MSGASSSSDPFARRAAAMAARDHFAEKARRKAAKGGSPGPSSPKFAAPKSGAPNGDAFASGAAAVRLPPAYPDAFAGKRAPQPEVVKAPRAEKPARSKASPAQVPAVKVPAVKVPAARPPERIDDDFWQAVAAPVAATAPEPPPAPRRILSNGAKLKVVKRQEPAELPLETELALAAEQAEARRAGLRRAKKAAKSSSLVLVTTSNIEAAAEAAPETASGGSGEAAPAAATSKREKPAKVKRAGGGGGSGGGAGGGGPRAPTPTIDRAFNQDDLMAALMVLALLFLTALYFMRGNGAKPQPLMTAQNNLVQPAAAPPPAPPPDKHGDKPIDLTPKSAIPAPAPEPVCPSGHTLRAWFCTDQAQLTDAAKASLEKDLAEWNRCFKDKELVVAGYADTRGPTEYNSYLGGERANVIATYLKSKGIKVAALQGVGELSGLTDNQNCANQRRVDISFAGDESEAPMRSCAPPKDFAELVCG